MSRLERQYADHDLLFLYNRFTLTRTEDAYTRTLSVRPFESRDRRYLLRLVRNQLGTESAKAAGYWFDVQPENAYVLSEPGGAAVGYLQLVEFGNDLAVPSGIDSAIEHAYRFISTNAPLQRGEHASFHRFLLADERRPAGNAVERMWPLQSPQLTDLLSEPRPAFTFMIDIGRGAVDARWNDWSLMRLDEAAFTIDGRLSTVYGYDRRRAPLDEVRVAGGAGLQSRAQVRSRMVSRTEFHSSVGDALRDFTKPWKLATNPLAHSRLVTVEAGDHAGLTERVEALATVIRRGVDDLAASKRSAVRYETVRRTYLDPALSQRQAADTLDLSISTYRRYLLQSVDELAEFLWMRETSSLS
jgi:hypothetical protein